MYLSGQLCIMSPRLTAYKFGFCLNSFQVNSIWGPPIDTEHD